jgi:uncharacterized protein (DUF2062 family)
VKAFLRSRIVDPLARQLTQGVSPGALALALALGATIGIFPVLGTTTLLCALVAAVLRLNQPAIQVANYVAYPVQIALYIPFFQGGAWLFGVAAPPITLELVRAELSADVWGTIARYAWANFHAVGAWAVVAVPTAVVLHLALRAILARLPLPGATRPAAP